MSFWIRNTFSVVMQEEEEDPKDKKGKEGKDKTKKQPRNDAMPPQGKART